MLNLSLAVSGIWLASCSLPVQFVVVFQINVLFPYSLSDNKVHGNRREVEKAIESCRCLFQVSGNTCYPMHDFYRCVACMFLYCTEGYLYHRFVSVSLPARLSVRQSFSPSVSQFVCPSVCLSVCLSWISHAIFLFARPCIDVVIRKVSCLCVEVVKKWHLFQASFAIYSLYTQVHHLWYIRGLRHLCELCDRLSRRARSEVCKAWQVRWHHKYYK